MKNSKLFGLNWLDIWKAFKVAFFTAVATSVYQAIDAGEFPHSFKEWVLFFKIPFLASLGYLIKNFFTKGDTVMLTGGIYTLWYTPAQKPQLLTLLPFLNFDGNQYQQWWIIIQELDETQVAQCENALANGKCAGFKPGSHPSTPPA